DLVGLIDKLHKNAVDEQKASESRTKLTMMALTGVGLVIGALVAILIARSITKAMGDMLGVIQEIANKNLTISDMEIRSQDEIGQAGVALNSMKNNLHQVMQSILDTAIHVANASEELSSTSQQISANSQETSTQANVVSSSAQ